MSNVLREYHTQVPLTEDQHAVGEFGSENAHARVEDPRCSTLIAVLIGTRKRIAMVQQRAKGDLHRPS
jgi:hypothetical protein